MRARRGLFAPTEKTTGSATVEVRLLVPVDVGELDDCYSFEEFLTAATEIASTKVVRALAESREDWDYDVIDVGDWTVDSDGGE